MAAIADRLEALDQDVLAMPDGAAPISTLFARRLSLAVLENERWYVARTHPQRELQAAKQLSNQSFRAFVPRYKKTRRHARKVETVAVPLFPRYLFVIADLTKDRWRAINGTYGVERLLMQGGEPLPVPPGVVETLIDAADADGIMEFGQRLEAGQQIKVTEGPFAELVGQLEQLDDNGRVDVLLEIMGRKIRVALPRALVTPCTDRG